MNVLLPAGRLLTRRLLELKRLQRPEHGQLSLIAQILVYIGMVFSGIICIGHLALAKDKTLKMLSDSSHCFRVPALCRPDRFYRYCSHSSFSMEMAVAIVGVVTGITGMILGIAGFLHHRFEVMLEFFEKIDSKEFIASRREVYSGKYLTLQDEDAAYVVNFFHQWGLFTKKHYLPIWVFDGATGAGAMRLYTLCEPHIELKQKETNDETYGEYFKWLYKKLYKRGKSPKPYNTL